MRSSATFLREALPVPATAKDRKKRVLGKKATLQAVYLRVRLYR